MYEEVPTEEDAKSAASATSRAIKDRARPITLWQKFTTALQGAARELWRDLCACNWRRIGIVLGIIIWLAALGCAAGFASTSGKVRNFCSPTDQFTTEEGTYNLWKLSETFQITLAFGSLTFGMAKFIDIAFDIVVGRGGQALLALITYYTFKRYIVSVMTQISTSFGTYKGVFFERSISFAGICHLISDFWRHKPLKSAVAMTWLILSAAYIVSFPTLASAMTGYKPQSQAFVQDTNGNYLSYDKLYPVTYIINDASRINMTMLENFIFARENTTLSAASESLEDPRILRVTHGPGDCPKPASYTGGPKDDVTQLYFDCYLTRLIDDYVRAYGFFGLNQTRTYLVNQTIESPALNITAYYIPISSAGYSRLPYEWSARYASYETQLWRRAGIDSYLYGYYLHGNDWRDPRTNQTPFANAAQSTYATATTGNSTVTLGAKSGHGRCQPRADNRYSWGFSFILLFICVVLTMIWTVGSSLLVLAASMNQWPDKEAQVPGEYRAIVQLATAMDQEFEQHGEDLQSLSANQIRRFIKDDLKGGHIKLPSVLSDERPSWKLVTRAWLRDNKWWILAFCITLAIASILMGLWFFAIGSFFAGLALATLFSLCVVSRSWSRWLATCILSIPGIVMTIWLSGGMG